MASVNWQNFGLKKNPYDTLPLLEGGDIPIEGAFVGRVTERKIIDSVLESGDRGCLIIAGNVGVGKTTLTNFVKFRRKNVLDRKPLFSSRREIEASAESLNKRAFLLEIIGSVLREIQLLEPDLVRSDALLKKLHAVVDLTQTVELSGGVSAFSFGINGGKAESTVQPFHLPTATIEGYFRDLIEFIRIHRIADREHCGLIVHMNNFDVVMKEDNNKKLVLKFFNEIRDVLQIPHVYFIFLGPKNFFRETVGREPRVRAVFHQSPIVLEPLTKMEIVDALDKRMSAIQSENVSHYIKPFTDEVVFELYDLYEGDIRSVLGALLDITAELGDRVTEPLGVNKAIYLLSRERWRQIEGVFTSEQKKVLEFIVRKGEAITQNEIVTCLGKTQGNVAYYYFGPLKDSGVIEEVERRGKQKYWYLTKEFSSLKYLLTAEVHVQEDIEEKIQQARLF